MILQVQKFFLQKEKGGGLASKAGPKSGKIPGGIVVHKAQKWGNKKLLRRDEKGEGDALPLNCRDEAKAFLDARLSGPGPRGKDGGKGKRSSRSPMEKPPG